MNVDEKRMRDLEARMRKVESLIYLLIGLVIGTGALQVGQLVI